MTKNKVLVIHTRDLRYRDNALYSTAFSIKDASISSCFVFTTQQIDDNSYFSCNSFKFMLESLKELDIQLKQHEINLHYLYGDLEVVIKDILHQNEISDIVISKDYSAYAKDRESLLKAICLKNRVNLHVVDNHYLCLIIKEDNSAYKKFTPYATKVKQYLKDPKYTNIMKYKPTEDFATFKLKSSHFTTLKDMHEVIPETTDQLVKGGTTNAHKILEDAKMYSNYHTIRDDLSLETTRLSAYLKFGCVSIRETYKAFNHNPSFINELIWRDFYAAILDSRPDLVNYKTEANKSFNLHYDNIKWHSIKSEPYKTYYKKWKNGETGYPIVDAAMHELNQTGYMHNRCRMIVASFLTKILLIDWRIGEKYFAKQLTDYDPASNNGGWQWCSGSGVDAQPYFRIFNPELQHKKHDPQSKYVKKWLPKLEKLTHKEIMSIYSNPDKLIVDYAKSKEIVLQAYKKYISHPKGGNQSDSDVEVNESDNETKEEMKTTHPLQKVYETNKIRLLQFLEPYKINESQIQEVIQSSDPYNYLKECSKASDYEIDRVATRINQFKRNIKLNVTKLDNYLDFGCNNGNLSVPVGESLGFTKDRIFGVDILEKTSLLPENYHQAKDSILIPPFKPNQFKLISAQMVLHHIENLSETMNQLSKVAAKGCIFYLREHDISNADDVAFIDMVHTLYNKCLPADSTDEFGDAAYSKYFSVSEWEKLFAKHGFIQVHLHYVKSIDRNPQNKFIAVYKKQ